MSSFPDADEIISAYLDQVEALERLLHARATICADPRSRFHQLADADVQGRLREDRIELDRWAVLMLVASFEATLRADAKERIDARTKDAVRRPLQALHKEHEGRVRLDDILEVWNTAAGVRAGVKQALGTLLKHRHWLAHGRHWTNKHGPMPTPLEAHAALGDYVQALAAFASDFPLG